MCMRKDESPQLDENIVGQRTHLHLKIQTLHVPLESSTHTHTHTHKPNTGRSSPELLYCKVGHFSPKVHYTRPSRGVDLYQ
jgi:hypothetical protein